MSSITKYTPKAKEVFEVLDDDFFIKLGFKIVTTTVDEAKAKEWVERQLDKGDIDMNLLLETFGDICTLETTHKQETAKINRRKS